MTKCEKILVAKQGFKTRRGATAAYQIANYLRETRRANRAIKHPFVLWAWFPLGAQPIHCESLNSAKLLGLSLINSGQAEGVFVKDAYCGIELWSK